MNGRGYIGGSSIPGILGVSPFRTPLDEYLNITGEADTSPSPEDRAFFDDRKEWEPIAFKRFERVTGMKILRTNVRYDDPNLPWAKAEIDFEPSDVDNGETKTSRPELAYQWGVPGVDEPPLYVTAQAMWGLGVTRHLGKQHTYVQRFGLDENDIYHVDADDALIIDIRDRAAFFWKHHIEKRRPPQPSTLDDVLKLYGRGTDRAVEASDDIKDALEARAKAMNTIAIHDAIKLQAELEIKKFMRDASVLTIGGRVVATWKADVRGIRTFRTK
jgi:predicted phage-related endonuclease